MKKTVARITLIFLIIGWVSYACYTMLIEPCVSLYEKFGIVGVIGWVLVLLTISIFLYGLYKIMVWAVNNS